jgi:hypothetical protein
MHEQHIGHFQRTPDLIRPDSSKLATEAFKELILRREPRPLEKEAYLVRGIEKSEIPDGSFVEIEVTK